MIDLSVVILTYNSSLYIEECLQALLKELPDIKTEIIFIENNSADNTLFLLENIINSSIPKNIDVKLIKNDRNKGYALGNNQGLEISSGRQILLLHPDVVMLANSLKYLLKVLEEDTKIVILAPQFQYPDGKIQPSCRRFPDYWSVINEALGLTILFPKNKSLSGWKMGDFDHTYRREVDQPMAACVLLKRKVLDDVGLMDEQFVMFFNDVDWCKRMKQFGWKIIFTPEAKVIHVLGGSVNQVRSRMILHSHVGFYLYFEKHFRTPTQRALNQLMGLILFLSVLPRIILQNALSVLRLR